jgi:hypothetical protein
MPANHVGVGAPGELLLDVAREVCQVTGRKQMVPVEARGDLDRRALPRIVGLD